MPKAKSSVAASAPKTSEAAREFVPGSASIPELKQFLEGPGINLDRFNPGGKAEIMLRHLASQVLQEGKVRTLIPLAPKEKRGQAFETVILNGLRLNILKGVFVDLPPQVAQMISDSYYATQEALEQMRADRDELKEGIHISSALNE